MEEGVDPSLRALFHQRLEREFPNVSKYVRLAEDANKWSKAAKHYDNLLDLENDLAHISACILLFVESAGSIAELGAFSQAPALREKLVAVLEHGHQRDDSFINNGPVANLRSHNPDSVIFYPWLSSGDKHANRRLDKGEAYETVTLLLKWLSEYMAGLRKEEKFRKAERAHTLLLIADCINLGTIFLYKEILASLKALGVDFAPKDLEKCLFLLQKLELIDETQYGNNTYYVSGRVNAEFVHYAYKQKGKFWDRQQVIFDIGEPLLLDSHRKNAWKLYLEGR